MHLLVFPVNSFCFATNSHTAVVTHETLCGIQSTSGGDVVVTQIRWWNLVKVNYKELTAVS